MEFLNQLISFSGGTVALFGAFLICLIGYAIGHIQIKGLSLGTAGVFLAALLFGYLFTLPQIQSIPVLGRLYVENASSAVVGHYKFMESVGLILFVTSVGFIAGPNFFRDLKKNAKSYVPMGIIIIAIGAILTALFAIIPGIGSAFANGVLSGALTSTPAFSAAKQVASADAQGLVALGHAVAYPFGVIGVVLFVQIIPRLVRANMEKERGLIMVETSDAAQKTDAVKHTLLDEFGFASFGLAVVLGILLGSIKIPLTSAGFKGACFSLGNTGGPLIMALILGHFGHIGKLNMRVPDSVVKVFREFGLMLFLIGAGVEGGVELVAQVQASEYGVMLVVYGFLAGAAMTTIPMLVGYFCAKKWFRLPLLYNLGSITGGMTSTPALGTLISVAGTDDVASAYASTYPMALVLIVLVSNLIGTFIA